MTDEPSGTLPDFKNRKTYRSFDLQTLAQISDADLEQALLDYVIFRIGNDWSQQVETVDALSSGFRAIYTTIGVEAEVCNGGFNQYFWNSRGRLAAQAVEGFRRIGAPEYADLMQRAIATWRSELPVLEQFKEVDTLEAFSESYGHTTLGKLDDEFYELAEVSDLSELRLHYIRSHVHEFVTQDG